MRWIQLSLTSPWFVLGAGALLILLLLVVGRVPLRYNLRNLLLRWKTTVVTALAFTLVISLLIVMLAFVTGMSRLTEATGQPANVMIMSDGATDEAFSNLPPGVSILSLPDALQKQIERDAHGEPLVSQEVYVIVNQPLPNPTPGGAKRRFVQMRGITNPLISARVHDIELLSGRWFAGSGVPEVVLGEGVARVLGADLDRGPLQPGETVTIGPQAWKVAGVMKSSGSTFSSEVWARDGNIQNRFGREGSYTVFVARTKDPALARAAAQALRESRGSGGQALQAIPELEYYAKLGETNQQFLVAVYFVAVVMAVGGVLGVMNTMFAAISQRTKDIGVLRLLGYTRLQVLVSFLLESLVIALVGGLLGCALGSLANGWTASSIVSSGGGGGGKSVVLKLIVDGNVLAKGLALTLVMGWLGGLIPSLSAMRLRPLESLR